MQKKNCIHREHYKHSPSLGLSVIDSGVGKNLFKTVWLIVKTTVFDIRQIQVFCSWNICWILTFFVDFYSKYRSCCYYKFCIPLYFIGFPTRSSERVSLHVSLMCPGSLLTATHCYLWCQPYFLSIISARSPMAFFQVKKKKSKARVKLKYLWLKWISTVIPSSLSDSSHLPDSVFHK